MKRLPRSVRLSVFAAALLHALVGGWGAWLHGAAGLDGPVVHAAAESTDAAAQPHDADCALCHTAGLHKHPGSGRGLWPSRADAGAAPRATSRPLALPLAPVRTGGARAPPRTV